MTLPTYFISHGGGPWPWIPEMRQSLRPLEQSLADMPRQIGVTPKAILMVSGHWEDHDAFLVMANPKPPMLYDYGGFPAHTYQVQYPAPGSPELAQRVMALIAGAGLPTELDTQRGFDHGMFSPMAVMYPEANVPVVQLSMMSDMDPARHIALGRALAPLRNEGVLIIGSGLSYHNLRRMGPAAKEPSEAFDAWLRAAVNASPKDREAALLAWEKAPAARISHPHEDHLIPLMVAVGAAYEDAATRVYHQAGAYGGMVASSYAFGLPS
jgi:aromatic ring-opening dioxygenase catalytic subunit (LigB family)